MYVCPCLNVAISLQISLLISVTAQRLHGMQDNNTNEISFKGPYAFVLLFVYKYILSGDFLTAYG